MKYCIIFFLYTFYAKPFENGIYDDDEERLEVGDVVYSVATDASVTESVQTQGLTKTVVDTTESFDPLMNLDDLSQYLNDTDSTYNTSDDTSDLDEDYSFSYWVALVMEVLFEDMAEDGSYFKIIPMLVGLILACFMLIARQTCCLCYSLDSLCCCFHCGK